MHIGILQTDSVRETLRPTFGDYPAMFEQVLTRAQGPCHTFEIFNVLEGSYPSHLDACEGYVITGSRESVYDDREWIRVLEDFIRALDTHRKKTVGICFGHQLIAQALGGVTEAASEGWGVGVHAYTVEAVRPWMRSTTEGDTAQFRLLCSHKDQVTELPPGARRLATSRFCPNAAFEVGRHFVTFQGHPEFTKAYARELLDMREELLGDAYAPAIRSLVEATDEVMIGRWMLDFLVSDQADD